MNSQLQRRIASAALIIGFFVLWEFFCLAFGISDIVLPKPSQIIDTLWQRLPALLAARRADALHHAGRIRVRHSVRHVARHAGRLVAACLRRGLSAADRIFASIPKVAVVPIFVLWFGAGAVPAILTAHDLVDCSRSW